jgi:hypothetical protein
MTTWLPTSRPHLAMEQDDRSVPKRPRTGALRRIQEVLSICARARTAAHHYEELKPKSDADLDKEGLTRADLPRAAFKKLTGES